MTESGSSGVVPGEPFYFAEVFRTILLTEAPGHKRDRAFRFLRRFHGVSAIPPRRSDSLFRNGENGVRAITYTFRLGSREQPQKLSRSLVNSSPVVNRFVRLGPQRHFELPARM